MPRTVRKTPARTDEDRRTQDRPGAGHHRGDHRPDREAGDRALAASRGSRPGVAPRCATKATSYKEDQRVPPRACGPACHGLRLALLDDLSARRRPWAACVRKGGRPPPSWSTTARPRRRVRRTCDANPAGGRSQFGRGRRRGRGRRWRDRRRRLPLPEVLPRVQRRPDRRAGRDATPPCRRSERHGTPPIPHAPPGERVLRRDRQAARASRPRSRATGPATSPSLDRSDTCPKIEPGSTSAGAVLLGPGGTSSRPRARRRRAGWAGPSATSIFGNEAYAREELVAELGTALLGRQLGFTADHLDDHAAYVGHWIRALRGDRRFLFTAATHAQRAVDWLAAAAAKGGVALEEDEGLDPTPALAHDRRAELVEVQHEAA